MMKYNKLEHFIVYGNYFVQVANNLAMQTRELINEHRSS